MSRKVDEFTPFRYYLRQARARAKNLQIALEDLKKVWEKQKGLCAITGLPIELSTGKGKSNLFTTASLDRINSAKSYERKNIQFVILSLNLAKQTQSNRDFLKFLRKIKNEARI